MKYLDLSGQLLLLVCPCHHAAMFGVKKYSAANGVGWGGGYSHGWTSNSRYIDILLFFCMNVKINP